VLLYTIVGDETAHLLAVFSCDAIRPLDTEIVRSSWVRHVGTFDHHSLD